MANKALPTFGTQDWADQFAAFLNKNPNYKDSAKMWEGALVLEFLAEGSKLKRDAWIWMDLWHGECRSVVFLPKRDEKIAQYYIMAKESVWYELVKGTINPQAALVGGKFKMAGEVSKLMRFPKAAAYIIKYLARLLQDW